MNKKAFEIMEEFSELENIDFDKLPDLQPGDHIEIYWKNIDYEFELPDKGYVLTLPNTVDADCGNVIIHVPMPNNYSGKDEAEEVFIHLIDLSNNNNFKKICIVERLKFV